jgi:hypothetical protein
VRLGNTNYNLGGQVGTPGGSLSLSYGDIGVIGSVRFSITNAGSLDIDEINTKQIYSGQGVFGCLLLAVAVYGNTRDCPHITSTNVTNSSLWADLATKGKLNIPDFLGKTNSATLPRLLKEK